MATAIKRKNSTKRPNLQKKLRSASIKTETPQGSRPVKSLVGKLRNRLNVSQPVLARMLPASTRSIATLESGVAPSESVARRLVELDRLTIALSEVMKSGSLGQWLQIPNAAFDNLKPLEVIERGESDRIWSMIYFLRSGVAS